MPTSITEDVIHKELLELKYPVIKITRLLHPDCRPMPIVAAILEDTDQEQEILSLIHLLHYIIKVEVRRKSGPPRCRRCQKVGHTKNYCSLTPICIRCHESHLTTDCSLPIDTPSRCLRCKKNHALNLKCISTSTAPNTRPQTFIQQPKARLRFASNSFYTSSPLPPHPYPHSIIHLPSSSSTFLN